ncbi:MAG: hypothetical protein ACOZDY_12750 [Pseudomonadota bacterium]
MPPFKPGQRVLHPLFGLGTVLEDEAEGRVKVRFDRKGERLLDVKFARLRPATPEGLDALEPGGEGHRRWLELFRFEPGDTPHFMGSRWEPFFDDVGEVFERLPQLVPEMRVHGAFADHRPAPRKEPPEWPAGFHLSWPGPLQGVMAVLRMEPKFNNIVSLYPFWSTGSQHTLTIEQVRVWESGVEAQIDAVLEGAAITFFDTLYAVNRTWYEAGGRYEFVLTGIAYACRRAEDHPFEIRLEREERAFLRDRARKDGWESEPEEIEIMHTTGMAMLLPIDQWDADDYQFHGPVKSVKEIEMLGQTGWRLRTTVLRRLGKDGDIDLDIIVTRRAWGDGAPPLQGEDVEGRLWLQGYLWYPHNCQ